MEAPDLDRYPLFQQAAFTELVLGPGDMLFIPKVRSCAPILFTPECNTEAAEARSCAHVHQAATAHKRSNGAGAAGTARPAAPQPTHTNCSAPLLDLQGLLALRQRSHRLSLPQLLVLSEEGGYGCYRTSYGLPK